MDKSIKTFGIVALAMLVLPFGVYGAQAVFTQQGVEVAYENQIEAIDAEISNLQGQLVPRGPKMTGLEYLAIEDGVNQQINAKIGKLKEEKRIIEVSYRLIKESFI